MAKSCKWQVDVDAEWTKMSMVSDLVAKLSKPKSRLLDAKRRKKEKEKERKKKGDIYLAPLDTSILTMCAGQDAQEMPLATMLLVKIETDDGMHRDSGYSVGHWEQKCVAKQMW